MALIAYHAALTGSILLLWFCTRMEPDPLPGNRDNALHAMRAVNIILWIGLAGATLWITHPYK